MTPTRWSQIKEVFNAALETPQSERPRFLESACGGDADLRAEVERLLAGNEEPSWQSPAAKLFTAAAELAPGDTVAHYRIEVRLGEGGMGVVYKAKDTRLGRSVALKFIKAQFSQHWEREARAVAALNHPHIATLYEVGDHEGSPYLAMELVDGQRLQGPLPVKQAIEYGIQIADALAAAHTAGLVHRDLKPGNILVTEKSSVKVLDFGLAKLAQPEGAPASTQTPGLAGTPGYMAPEQIEGKPADTRSDIFAFGCILYELLSGRRAFPGETVIAALTAAATTEPEPLDGVPERLDELVRLCLRKDPARRFQHMDDVKVELEELKEAGGGAATRLPHTSTKLWRIAIPGTGSAARAAPRPNRMLWTVAGLSVLSLLVVGLWLWAVGRARSLAVLRPQTMPFTTLVGSVARPAFSPDGKQIAYSWSGEDGASQSIYVKLVGSETHLRLTTPPGSDNTPAWSPDGRFIAFYRNLSGASGYYMVSALGGAVRQILRTDVPDSMAQTAWFPDGRRLVIVQRPVIGEAPPPKVPFSAEFQRHRLVSVDIATGQQKALTSPPAESRASDLRPAVSPDGNTIAFVRETYYVCEVYLMPIGGEPRRLTTPGFVTGLDWTADGRALAYSVLREPESELWRMPIDGGPAQRITSTTDFLSDPTVARQGNRLAYVVSITHDSLWRVDVSASDPPKAGPPKRAIYSTRSDFDPMYSPDGRKVAFASDRSGAFAIWVSDPDGQAPLQLTQGAGLYAGSPRWSPDGSLIAFDARHEGKPEIYVVPAGGGDPRRITSNQAEDVVPSWSRDGKWIYFASNRSGDFQIWRAPAATGELPATPALQVTHGGGFNAVESADGKYLYFAKGRGKTGLWRRGLTGGPDVREEPVLESLQYWGMWALGPHGIFFLQHPDGLPNANADLKYMDLISGRITSLLTLDKPINGALPAITGSPDGRHLVYQVIEELRSNIILMEGFR